MEPFVAFLSYGTLIVDVLLLGGLAIFIADKLGFSVRENRFVEKASNLLEGRYREVAFLQALIATLGSLYLSNILGWEPCRLCWFQRIAIYPLTVILGTSLVLDKKDVADYVLPITIIGIPISIYHYAIQRYEQFHSAGCSVLSVSCSTKYTYYFDYITIPMMALTALVVIAVLMWRFSPRES